MGLIPRPPTLFLLVIALGIGQCEGGPPLGKQQYRKTRNADVEDPSRATIPDLREALEGQSSVQAAYFLGQCLMCPPGPQGPPGVQGSQGPPGRDGRDALLVGYPPTDGHGPGPDDGGPENPGQPPLSTGASYTRWGRRTCPDGAELIYEGAMAGSHYTHGGGAANYLCLTKQPLFDRPTGGFQYGTYIYGTEYETGSSNLMPNLQDFEVPCAVCLAPRKSLTLMVPGRNECPEGPTGREWRLEYSGLIMSQHSTHPRTEYVCVDAQAEGIPSTHGDHNGALLYIVEAQCVNGGGIPCPPYNSGFEVTCAVCTL